MNVKGNVIVVVAVAALSFTAGRLGSVAGGSVASAQPGQDEAPIEVTPEMQAMLAVATPGRHHRVLEQLIGEWSGEFTMQMTHDGESMTARGTVTREWALDGRFVKEVVEAQTDAGTFEGLGYIGYDNFDGQYDMVWMDNQSTAIQMETGTYHPDEKVMHVRGGHRDPASGRLVNTWSKLDLSDPDRHTMTGYATDADGRTFKAAQGVLERRR